MRQKHLEGRVWWRKAAPLQQLEGEREKERDYRVVDKIYPSKICP